MSTPPSISSESQSIRSHRFDSGLVLVAERMDWVESVAFTLLIPAGCGRDPSNRLGLANFSCEMVQRGCGDRTSRQFVDDLENLGVERSASVGNAHTSFGAAMPAENLAAALEIHADIILKPHLPASQLEDGRQVCVQEIRALEDDLAQKTMLELRHLQYPDPYCRNAQGTLDSIRLISLEDIHSFVANQYRPRGAILSVAGKLEWESLKDQVSQLFSGWSVAEPPPLIETPPSQTYVHLLHESSQTHIGVAYESVPYSHADYFQARGAVGVLSDGMSSRLFTEVREKRGLVYTVYASCHSMVDRGSVVSYAGTTTERAQETLDVVLAELRRLSDGVEQDELDRLKARIKSALVMQQESSSSRSSAIAGDWYYLGRVRTLEELSGIIDALTCDSINAYLRDHPPRDFKVVTLGEIELEVGS